MSQALCLRSGRLAKEPSYTNHFIGAGKVPFTHAAPFGTQRASTAGLSGPVNIYRFPPIEISEGKSVMIELTRFNGSSLVVNSDLIQYVESAPDTTLTLLNGDKVVVRESARQVVDLTVAFRARLMRDAAVDSSGGMAIVSGAARASLPADKAVHTAAEIETSGNVIARRRRTES